ncbi:MAG TPA: caspase family protein [Polyangia bacterium]|nr:caspase family protein [Polyangia bacterium]
MAALLGVWGPWGQGAARAGESAEGAETVAVIVGANVGAHEEGTLLYAESDARRMREVLIMLGGARPERTLLVVGGGAEQVMQAITEARGRVAEISATGRPVTFLFYYSGHGDEQALHLGRGPLPLSRLRQALASVPAKVRIGIFDACRSGVRTKGVTRGQSFSLDVMPEALAGTVEIFGASLGEPAQESVELGGSIFTHYLVSGLRGEADSDENGRVTLTELYSYAYRKTVLRTGTGDVLQHPAIELKLSGAGEIVLSRLAAAVATLEVSRDAARYLVFSLPSETMLGELSSEGSGRLALPAGRFLVVRRTSPGGLGGRTGVALVDLPWGGRRRLVAQEFRPIARPELVARGGHIELRPYRLEPLFGMEVGGRPAYPAWRTGLGFAYSRGLLELQLSAVYVGSQASIGQDPSLGPNGLVHSISGGPSLGVRFFHGRLVLAAIVGLELRYSWQRPDGYVCPPGACKFGSLGPRVGVRFIVALGHHLTLDFTPQALALFRFDYLSRRLISRPIVSLDLGLGYSF